jgi:hypothetical protein
VFVGTNANTYTATELGAYTVQIINSCGVIAADTTLVIEQVPSINPDLYSITVFGNDTTLCGASDLIILNVVPNDGVGVKWFRNGTELPQGTATLETNQPGTYTARVFNTCGEFDIFGTITVTAGDSLASYSITINGPTTFCADEATTLLGPVVANASYQWLKNGAPIADASQATYSPTETGVYTLRISTKCGSFVSQNGADITVRPLPPTPVVSQVGNELVSSSPVGNQWLDSNGNPIAGATSPNFTPTTPGNYSVVVTNAEGCSAQSPLFNFIPTSVEKATALGWKYFPNPTAGELNLQGVPAGTRVEVVGLTGQTLSVETTAETGIHTLNVAFLPAGFYLLRAWNGNNPVLFGNFQKVN